MTKISPASIVLVQPTRSQSSRLEPLLLREREVAAVLGVCRSTIRRWVACGVFPPPLRLPGRRVAWPQAEVATRVAARQGGALMTTFGRPGRNGRSSSDPKPKDKAFLTVRATFVAIPAEVIVSDAFRTLGIHGRRILDALLVEHNAHAGRENGRLIVTYDQLERAWGVSRRKIAPAIRDLERRGLVRRTAVGCGNRKTGERQPSRYRLTFLGSLPDRLNATDEWRAFTAPSGRKKTGGPVSQHDDSGLQQVASARRSRGDPREG